MAAPPPETLDVRADFKSEAPASSSGTPFLSREHESLFESPINPSAWGRLIPSSYCDVGRFPAGYLTFELNCAGIYSN